MGSTGILLYWLVGLAAGGALVVATVAPLLPSGWRAGTARRMAETPGFYAALVLVALLAGQWPVFFVGHELNPDESQFLAGALTLTGDPVFWRSVDGQSAGPLVYYALVPLKPLGLMNYFGARMVACLCLWGALWFSYRGLRAVWGEGWGRLAVLPAAVFFATSTRPDWVHYSSEHVSLWLLAVGLAGILTVIARDTAAKPGDGGWWSAGIALGAIPFAKLQAVPAAAGLILGAVAWVATRRDWPAERRWCVLAAWGGAIWIVPLTFAAMLTIGGAWEAFGISYLSQNLVYTAAGWRGLGGALRGMTRLVTGNGMFAVLAGGAVIVAAVFRMRCRRLRPVDQWAEGLLLAGLLASAAASLSTRGYEHYLLYLVLPLSLWAGGWAAVRDEAADGGGAGRGWTVAVVLGLLVAPQVVNRLVEGNRWLALMEPGRIAPKQSPLGREILSRATPDDTLVVWGWWAAAHVQTGLRQGTREANTFFQSQAGPHRDYHRRRFLEDLEKNRPKFFIDQVTLVPLIDPDVARVRAGALMFPAVQAYVESHYDLVTVAEHSRLYVRRAKPKAERAPAGGAGKSSD